METRASYIAVGSFVLICVIGLVVTLLWLAGAQYSQEFSYYQTHFKGPVTGLGKGTITRYNGIDVGRITDLKFDPADPQSVIVTLQVQPGLNIREDSTASIESQGLTGGSYVEISGGGAQSPLLVAKDGQQYPVIRTQQSSLAQLEQSAPEVVAKMNVAASRINDLLSDDNRHAIAHILSSLDETTSAIARHSGDIDATVQNASVVTANLRQVTASLKPTIDDLKPTIDDVDLSIRKFGKVADDADTFVNGEGLAQLPTLISEMRRLVSTINRISDQIDRNPTTILFGDRRKGYEPNGK
jgi:phospholipid/cholesterol/gamma-HCH transport system substrate-binding protein